MLKMDGVKKTYKDFQLDCTLEIKEGYITGLIGSNGAGKSTAFKAALGIIRTDSGDITILNKPLKDIKAKDKEEMGVVLADSEFNGDLSTKEIIAMLSAMYAKFNKEWFIKKCKELNIPLKKKVKELSTGTRRKLQVIAALSHEAKLLIMDEPTAGLDVMSRDIILDMIREYMEQNGRAVVISSHISSDLESLCDDIYMIDKGKIIMHEDTDVLMTEYGILKLTQEQYEKLDRSYILKTVKAGYGYKCLTNERHFYQDNYKELVIENGSIDRIMKLIVGSEQ